MAKIVILGAGVMGTAFSFPPADLGHEIRLVGTHLDYDIIEALNTTRIHPKLKTKVADQVSFYHASQISEAMGDHIDLLVLGVSSAGVDWAVEAIRPYWNPSIPILMLTKGLSIAQNQKQLIDQLQILPDRVAEQLSKSISPPSSQSPAIQIGAVGGPCIAGELASRRHTRVTIAWRDPELFSWTTSLLATDYYHIQYTHDLVGLELCAALKNFYALAVGYPSGLLAVSPDSENQARMHNLSAGLFTQSVLEMSRIVTWMGGDRENVFGLAGTGDLYVTCQAGRNSRMGYLLGTGMVYSKAKEGPMAEDTVEGAELALTIGPLLEHLLQSQGLPMDQYPLANTVIQAICHDKIMQIPWELL